MSPIALLRVLELREKAVKAVKEGSREPVWLPTAWIMPLQQPDTDGHRARAELGPEAYESAVPFYVPPWLWERCRPLCGNEVFEEAEARRLEKTPGG
jgi:hypothetical protein